MVLRRRPFHKPQAQTRGERRSLEKGPFMDGNQLGQIPVATYNGMPVLAKSVGISRAYL
jgi:hypothetical protein